jgi:hypothetical protein
MRVAGMDMELSLVGGLVPCLFYLVSLRSRNVALELTILVLYIVFIGWSISDEEG